MLDLINYVINRFAEKTDEIEYDIKEEGKNAFPGSTIRVGATFDIGPEFAISDFKYRRHNEICSGAKLDTLGFVVIFI